MAEDLLVILVVEDDPLIQILVEEQLTDGGFELAIATSGEDAVTLLKGGNTKYRALVTDINLHRKMDGWDVGTGQRDRPGVSSHLHDGRCGRSMGLARRSQQHSFDQTVRTRPACHCHFPASQ